MVEKLKVEGKINLFAIFPIGATMQDGGKRKRSDGINPCRPPTTTGVDISIWVDIVSFNC